MVEFHKKKEKKKKSVWNIQLMSQRCVADDEPTVSDLRKDMQMVSQRRIIEEEYPNDVLVGCPLR